MYYKFWMEQKDATTKKLRVYVFFYREDLRSRMSTTKIILRGIDELFTKILTNSHVFQAFKKAEYFLTQAVGVMKTFAFTQTRSYSSSNANLIKNVIKEVTDELFVKLHSQATWEEGPRLEQYRNHDYRYLIESPYYFEFSISTKRPNIAILSVFNDIVHFSSIAKKLFEKLAEEIGFWPCPHKNAVFFANTGYNTENVNDFIWARENLKIYKNSFVQIHWFDL